MNLNKTIEKNLITFSCDLTDKYNEIEQQVYKNLASNLEVDGFRKGSVPVSYIKKNFSEEAINDAINKAIISKYYDKFNNELKAILDEEQPKMIYETFKFDFSTKILKFFVCLPAKLIDLKNYDKLTLVDNKNNEIMQQFDNLVAEYNEKISNEIIVKDTIENGDYVIFDFKGSIEGEYFEGGTAEQYGLEIGSGQFIPGFEEQMIGMKTNEEKTITVNFPNDYGAPEFAGKEAQFELKIHKILVFKNKEKSNSIIQKDKIIEQIRYIVYNVRPTIRNFLQLLNQLLENATFEEDASNYDEILTKIQYDHTLKVFNKMNKASAISFESFLPEKDLQELHKQIAIDVKANKILMKLANIFDYINKSEKIDINLYDQNVALMVKTIATVDYMSGRFTDSIKDILHLWTTTITHLFSINKDNKKAEQINDKYDLLVSFSLFDFLSKNKDTNDIDLNFDKLINFDALKHLLLEDKNPTTEEHHCGCHDNCCSEEDDCCGGHCC